MPDQTLFAEVCNVRTIQIEPDVRIGYTLLNARLLGKAPPIVAIGGFLADLTMPERAWEGVQLAALGRPVLMLDTPGHGLSSPHNFRQVIELCFRRRTNSQAAPLLAAVQKLLDPHETIDYFGISHGAHLALKATELDTSDRVRAIYGIDIPAVKRRLTLGLNIGMFLNNTIGRRRYLRALRDTDHERDFKRFKAAFEQAGPARARWPGRRNPGLFLLNIFLSVNAGRDGLKTLRKIMALKHTKVFAMTSEKGTVSSPQAIERFIASLPAVQRERIDQIVFDGEDHNIGIAYLLPRAVAWVRSKHR